MALILTFYPLLTSGLILQFNKDLCEVLFGKVVFFHKLYTRLHDFRRVLVAFTNTAECVVNASALTTIPTLLNQSFFFEPELAPSSICLPARKLSKFNFRDHILYFGGERKRFQGRKCLIVETRFPFFKTSKLFIVYHIFF